jgi:hypothetical protein
MPARYIGLPVDRLELEDVSVELGALLGVRCADGELVDVALVARAVPGLLGIEVDAGVVLLLREIEDVAVGIVAAIGGERARRGRRGMSCMPT